MGDAARALDRHADWIQRDHAPAGPGGPERERLSDYVLRDIATGRSRTINGRRYDQPNGTATGTRFEWGLLYPGADLHGIRRYTAAGKPQVVVWVDE